MTEVKNPSTILSSNYFEVSNEIGLKIGEVDSNAKATYELVFKRKRNENHDIELTRLKFLINQKEIVNKFSNISNAYFECLFPMQFVIVNDTLDLSNYKEIKKRIEKTDEFLTNKYKGEGLNYIRKEFLDKVATELEMKQFVNSLNIVKIFNLTLNRFLENVVSEFNWTIPAIGNSLWNLKKIEDENEAVSFSSKQLNDKEFISSLNNYFIKNNLTSLATDEEIIESDFSTNIIYESTNLNIKELNNNCKIKVGKFFEYKENITIKSLL